MRHLFLLAALCFLYSGGSAQQLNQCNLDFEEIDQQTTLPAGWRIGNGKNTFVPGNSITALLAIDSLNKHSGKYSLLIHPQGSYEEWTASKYIIRRTFKGKIIKLTGYVKTENVERAGLWMRLDGKQLKKLAFDNMMNRPIKGTTDWTEYSIELKYDEDEVKNIVIGEIMMGKGKMWLDDLRISIDDVDISQAELCKPIFAEADVDTIYDHGSKISSVTLNDATIEALTNLGMLWGFLKYYHAGVNKGDVNMDAALFRVLPLVLSAGTKEKINEVLETWVDSFGKPELCPQCEDFKANDKTKLSPDYGRLFDKDNLPQSLREKLEYIRKNRYYAAKHYYIAWDMAGNPKFINELSYPDTHYPDAGVRLLSLYRYWNMIQYFFPDRHLIGEDWNKVLPACIPDFCMAADSSEYVMACLKLIARIHDTHANVWGYSPSLEHIKGHYITPFSAKFIEEQLVVTGYYRDADDVSDKIKPGDVIEQIDGQSVKELVKKYLPVTPASNYETQLRDLPRSRGFLLRSNSRESKFTINRDGKKLEVTIPRVAVRPEMGRLDFGNPVTTAYKLMDDNIGYIYPAALKDDDIDIIRDSFEHAKGIVIDMRCYPSTFMTFDYGAWLKPKSTPFVRFTNMSVDIPGMFETGRDLANGGVARKHFGGKVVIIVNAQTQSSAEYQTMALCTAPDAKVIGSQTAGADGNVSQILLPGGINTMISGIGILYPDGTESQRSGVKIDKVMKPTIKAFRDGRDELLEEAIKMIKG